MLGTCVFLRSHPPGSRPWAQFGCPLTGNRHHVRKAKSEAEYSDALGFFKDLQTFVGPLWILKLAVIET